MEIVKVIDKKVKNGKVVQYTVVDVEGSEINVAPNVLALTMKKGQIVCANLKLNDKGELEPYNSQEAIDKFNMLVSIRATNNANSKAMSQSKQQVKTNTKQSTINSAPSLCGVTLKNIKKNNGWEGPWYSATVYINGVRLGAWRQDDRGGSDWFDFNEKELDVVANDYFNRHNIELRSAEIFIGEVLDLCLDYKEFKSSKKKGYDYYIKVRIKNRLASIAISASNIYDSTNNLKPFVLKGITDCCKKLGISKEQSIVEIYHDDKDFIKN